MVRTQFILSRNDSLRVEGEEKNAYYNWPSLRGLGDQSNPRRGHRCDSGVACVEAREIGRRLYA